MPIHSHIKEVNIYRTLFETAGEGLVVVNEAGEILMINPRIEEMFGYSEDELTGQTVEVLMPLELTNVHRQHRKKYVKAPTRRSMGKGMTLRALRKDGSGFPVEIGLNHAKAGNE